MNDAFDFSSSIDDVMLDRKLLELLDSPEVDWEDDIPDLNTRWSFEELSPEVHSILFWSMLISDTTLDKQLRRTILQNIENYDIGTLKRIAYEVRCEEMGLLPDSTYIEYGITETEY